MDENLVSVQVRLPEALHGRLRAAAAERMVSANWLAARALEDFLARLVPVSELRLTRQDPT